MAQHDLLISLSLLKYRKTALQTIKNRIELTSHDSGSGDGDYDAGSDGRCGRGCFVGVDSMSP